MGVLSFKGIFVFVMPTKPNNNKTNKPSLLSSAGLLIALNLVVKPIWIFGIDRTVQLTAGQQVYGQYFKLFTYALLPATLLDVGINNYLSRYLAQNPQHFQQTFAPVVLLRLLLAAFYMIICFVMLFAQNNINPTYISLLSWFAIGQIFLGFLQFIRANLQGLHIFTPDSIISVIDRLLMIAGGGILLWMASKNQQPFNMVWYASLQTLCYGISFIVAITILHRYTKPWAWSNFRWRQNWSSIGFMLRNTWPFALLGLLMTVFTRGDVALLSILLPTEKANAEVDVYALAWRMLDALNIIGVLMATVLMPGFSRMLARNQPVNNIVGIAGRWLLVFAACASVAAWLGQLVWMRENTYAAQVFAILMLAFIAMVLVHIYGSLASATGKIGALNWLASGCFLFNFLLNTWLIPQYYALAAACIALLTQLFMLIGCLWLAKKYAKLIWSAKRLAQSLVFLAGCSTAYILTNKLLPTIHLFGQIGLACLSCFGWALLIGFISFADLKFALKWKAESPEA
ncbi:MAG: oligosaccharide flippase family protein [Sphingobacteriales bacterium]|nr:oligosaccharide flippase family protein [Sphingobacteriales bacterium]